MLTTIPLELVKIAIKRLKMKKNIRTKSRKKKLRFYRNLKISKISFQ